MDEEITNIQLAKLLNMGYGQVKYTDNNGKSIVSTYWDYDEGEDNEYAYVKIRSWDSVKWKPAMKDDYFEFRYPEPSF